MTGTEESNLEAQALWARECGVAEDIRTAAMSMDRELNRWSGKYARAEQAWIDAVLSVHDRPLQEGISLKLLPDELAYLADLMEEHRTWETITEACARLRVKVRAASSAEALPVEQQRPIGDLISEVKSPGITAAIRDVNSSL